jgi:glycosyltransferase involved in cell wall biosynthesis
MTNVTVVIPVYNEAARLAENLATTLDFLQGYDKVYHFDYVVVDDGSSDDSYEVARRIARVRQDFQVIRFAENRGVGAALRAGFRRASGEYVVTLDSDLSYSPDVVIAVLNAIQFESADIALASAYMPGGSVSNVPWLRKVLSREANRFLSMATNGRYATLTCMVRAYRRSTLAGLFCDANGPELNAELLFAALRAGAKVTEVPAHLAWTHERANDSSRLNWPRLGRVVWGVLRAGLHHRPALWLAIPGLIPGLLPFVVAALLLMRVSPQILAIGTVATLIVQYVSLGIFAGQTASFFGVSYFTRRRQAVRFSKP